MKLFRLSMLALALSLGLTPVAFGQASGRGKQVGLAALVQGDIEFHAGGCPVAGQRDRLLHVERQARVQGASLGPRRPDDAAADEQRACQLQEQRFLRLRHAQGSLAGMQRVNVAFTRRTRQQPGAARSDHPGQPPALRGG